MSMQEIMEEVDLDQFVNQPVPDDPEKLRLSLIFSKDLITTLQQDIADLHHRLQIADDDGTQEMEEDEEDLERAGVHVTNATLTKMDGDIFGNNDNNDHNEEDIDLYGDIGDINDNDDNNKRVKISSNSNLYEMNNDNDDDQNVDDLYDERAADFALNKKKSDHEKFFSTYNILAKQVNTPEQLIESMGSFEALIYLSDNAVTFSKIVLNLQMKLKTAKDGFNMVRDALDGIGVDINIDDEEDIMDKDGSLSDDEEQDLEKKLFISNAKEILRESKKIVDTIDSTIDELNGAKELIHPDHKKIFSLQSRIKELQVALPLHKIKKLAILNELPRFIKQELSDAKIQKQQEEARELQRLREARRGHKKKRTKTLVDDDIPDIDITDFKYNQNDDNNNNKNDKESYDSEKEEENRIENFDSTMDGVSTCIETLQSRLNNINDTIDAMEIDLEAMEDPSAELLKNSIGDIKDEMKTCEDKAHDIVLYFKQSKEYVHPTQNVLITAINQYIEQRVQNDALQKQIEILKGELSAKEEQIISLKNENDLKIKEEDIYNERNALEEQQDFVSMIAKQLRDITNKSLNIHNSLKQPQDDDDDNYINNDNSIESLKNKTSLSYDEIKKMDLEINDLRDNISDLSARLMSDDCSLLKSTPINEYLLTLEKRYLSLKKLYRLKFTELEKAKDAVIYNESLIETKNEEIEELESRLIRIMTSASSSAETRMEAINTMGHKSQTYRTVMDLIDDNLRTTSSALHEIEKLIKSNKNQNKIDQTDCKDIQNYCRTIKKGLQTVQEEMSGARNFVHPDREMVQTLQEQILLQNKYDDDNDTNIDIDIETQQQQQQQQDIDSTKRSKVQFQANNSKSSATINNGGSTSSSLYNNNRRTKSVHEIAWSKFNAGHETNMEDLQKKEREVLEEEIRNDIIAEIQKEYDDKFDQALAEMNAELQQKIREEIRLEYEDLEATISASTYQQQQQQQQQQQEQQQPQQEQEIDDIESIKQELERQYDNRLEKEKETIENHYNQTKRTLDSEIESLSSDKIKLQQENAAMQNEITNLKQNRNKLESEIKEIESNFKQEINDIAQSKLNLIISTSSEIDALRHKIKMYTEGNWQGIIN